MFHYSTMLQLAGGVLLAIGIWFMADSNALRILNVTAISSGDTLVRAAAIAIIVVGGLMFIVGGLGCFGACAENAVCLIFVSTTSCRALLLNLKYSQIHRSVRQTCFN